MLLQVHRIKQNVESLVKKIILHICFTCRWCEIFVKANSADEIAELCWHTLVQMLRFTFYSLPVKVKNLLQGCILDFLHL